MQIQLNDLEYRTHEAIVRVMGKTFTVPIKHDSTRAQQNAQIENWFKKANAKRQLRPAK
jgi:hypothetical protein